MNNLNLNHEPFVMKRVTGASGNILVEPHAEEIEAHGYSESIGCGSLLVHLIVEVKGTPGGADFIDVEISNSGAFNFAQTMEGFSALDLSSPSFDAGAVKIIPPIFAPNLYIRVRNQSGTAIRVTYYYSQPR